MLKLIYLTFNSYIDYCQITDYYTNIHIYLFHYVHGMMIYTLYLCILCLDFGQTRIYGLELPLLQLFVLITIPNL